MGGAETGESRSELRVVLTVVIECLVLLCRKLLQQGERRRGEGMCVLLMMS